MQFVNSASGVSARIRVDNIVYAEEGAKVVESMHSGIVDLSSPSANVLARMHPSKVRTLQWIATQQPVSATAHGSEFDGNERLSFAPDVRVVVNGPNKTQVDRSFSDLWPRVERLMSAGTCDEVARTVELSGFDPGTEPILREMRDGTLLLIFAALPPFATEDESAKQKAFELNAFASELQAAVNAPLIWDDRDVFVIQNPPADAVDRISTFLGNYWTRHKKPWWKVW